MTAVRTRFAPSPTGFQHIGGFRTALYAWLYARKHGGQFILRIEDTDQERRVPGAIRYIIESLQWLGLEYDEGPTRSDLQLLGEDSDAAPIEAGNSGPYIQSLRKDRYQAVARELIDSGFAYRCDCTPERLAAEREEQQKRKETPGYAGYCRTRAVPADVPHVVRFKIPETVSVAFDDAVRGHIVFDNPSLRDTVILKSDGFPTYHLASIVDDHDMEISHVLRGEEWLSTAPVHILLYEALGWKKPVFCHLSHILGPDGKKLSKRHGAEALGAFIEGGYLPDALVNFIARIGWSPGEGSEQEIFTRSQLIEQFSLDRVSKAGGVYDSEKLLWTNGVYIRNLPDEEFTELVRPYFQQAGLTITGSGWHTLLPHIKERCKVLPDAVIAGGFLFQERLDIDLASLVTKKLSKEIVEQVLEHTWQALKEVTHFKAETIEIVLKGLTEQLGFKAGQVFGPVRVAVTGSMQTPPLFESIEAVGQEKTVARLEQALAIVRHGNAR